MSTFKAQEKIASDLLKKKGIIIVHKATRTGATFCLILVALTMGLKVVVLTPTKKILKEIDERMPKLLKRPFRMAFIGPNTQLCRKLDPRLNIAFQLKANCSRCRFSKKPSECQLQNLILNDFDVYGLTYDKLQALQQSQSSEANIILSKLAQCEVKIPDESSLAVLADVKTIELVYKDRNTIVKLSESLEQLLPGDKSWGLVLRTFLKFFESRTQSGLYENIAWNSILSNKEVPKDVFVEGWLDITEMTEKGVDTSRIQLAFLSMFAKKVVVICEDTCISITPVIEDAMAYLKSFIAKGDKNQTVFIVDSYQPSVNFESLFGQVTHVQWGEFGDPLKTNSKQLIICDTYHFGVNDFFKDIKLQARVKATIEQVLKVFSPQDIMIVTTNKKMAEVIRYWSAFEWRNQDKLRITWFRSDLMRGVQAENRRIMVTVGGPFLPKKAYVASSKSFKVEDFAIEIDALLTNEQKTLQIPRLLKLDGIRSEFRNSIGRVKDAEAKEKSVVITLGMRIEEVKALLKDNSPFKISKPFVTQTVFGGRMSDEGLTIARLWLEGIEVEQPRHLAVLARIICETIHKTNVSASQVIVGQTELVKTITSKYQSILEKHGVKVVLKQGGMSFEKA